MTSAVGTVAGTTLVPDAPRLPLVGGVMTSLLLVLVAWLSPNRLGAVYRGAVTLGILCSLGGLLLHLSGDGTAWSAWMVFAAGHLCYLVAFCTQAPVFEQRMAVVAYAVVATGVLALLLPAVGGVLRGVLIGAVLIACATAAQGATWLLHAPRSGAARLAAIGSACLVSAHALMLLDVFAAVVPARAVLVLGGYWVAHICIAASVERPAPPTLRLS